MSISSHQQLVYIWTVRGPQIERATYQTDQMILNATQRHYHRYSSQRTNATSWAVDDLSNASDNRRMDRVFFTGRRSQKQTLVQAADTLQQ